MNKPPRSHRLVSAAVALALALPLRAPTAASLTADAPAVFLAAASDIPAANTAALVAATLPAAQPASLGAPISLVRVQSAARPSELSGGLVTITFTVFNNLPPILLLTMFIYFSTIENSAFKPLSVSDGKY